MEHGVSPGDYKDLVLFLATAGVVVPLFKRLKLSPILGFLGAGVALGPFGLGALADTVPWLGYFTVTNPAEIQQIAEFGVVFLLFMIGLELSWDRLRLLRHMVFGLGALQVGVSIAAISGLIMLMGYPGMAAVAAAAALALSSTAIVVPVLSEQKRLHSGAGRMAFSVLLFQDLAVAPILVTLALVGGHGGGGGNTAVFIALAQAIGGIAIVLVVGRLLLRPMFKSVSRAKSEELFMAACLLVVLGAGLVTALAGLSMALGAFIAGLLLAETEYRHEVEVTIEPFKGLFLGLFFVSVGIGLNLGVLASKPVLIVGLALGFLAIKAAAVGVMARAFKVKLGDAIEGALLLAAGGEFAFVIINQAMGAGIVPAPLGEVVMVSATLTMFAIPVLSFVGGRMRKAVTKTAPVSANAAAPEPPPAADGKARVLIVGYGRVGLLVGDMLDRHELPWVAIDREARLVEAGRKRGHTVFFGEASRAEFLRRCGLDDARAVVVTMDSPEAVEAVVATARQERPDMVIVARARDACHAKALYALGATEAVPETIEASLQLSEALLVDIGVPMGLVIASIHEKRDEVRTDLNRPDALGGRTRRMRDRPARGLGPDVGFVIRHQSFEGVEGGEPVETVRGCRCRPRQLFAHVALNERREPRVVVERRWPQVDEEVAAARPREHPSFAMRAKVMLGRAVQAANDGLALGDGKALAGDRGREGKGAGAHGLTAGAMTGHGQEGLGADPQSHPAAAASAVRWQLWLAHSAISVLVLA